MCSRKEYHLHSVKERDIHISMQVKKYTCSGEHGLEINTKYRFIFEIKLKREETKNKQMGHLQRKMFLYIKGNHKQNKRKHSQFTLFIRWLIKYIKRSHIIQN